MLIDKYSPNVHLHHRALESPGEFIGARGHVIELREGSLEDLHRYAAVQCVVDPQALGLRLGLTGDEEITFVDFHLDLMRT
jgi:hypothetical protein